MDTLAYRWGQDMDNDLPLFIASTWWGHDMETLSTLLALYEGNPLVSSGFPSRFNISRFKYIYSSELHNLQHGMVHWHLHWNFIKCYPQATVLDAWASRVKCPARFVSHLHEICIYIWVVYSLCFFSCLFITVTWWYVWCFEWASGNQKEVQACLVTLWLFIISCYSLYKTTLGLLWFVMIWK